LHSGLHSREHRETPRSPFRLESRETRITDERVIRARHALASRLSAIPHAAVTRYDAVSIGDRHYPAGQSRGKGRERAGIMTVRRAFW
jgi:hypothetical protein